MASSDLNVFVGSKVKYVGQRSIEGKCNSLSLSPLTLPFLKPDLDCRCLFVILIFLRCQRWARHITAIALFVFLARTITFSADFIKYGVLLIGTMSCLK